MQNNKFIEFREKYPDFIYKSYTYHIGYWGELDNLYRYNISF